MISAENNICASHAYVETVSKRALSTVDLPHQLTALRERNCLTQQNLVDRIGIELVQLRRYEAESSQPTLEVPRKLATALSVSADLLLFGTNERGPDDDLCSQFEAVGCIDPEGS